MRFYCYNSQEGMKPHETLEAAKQAAIEATKIAASASADPEATASLWGEVHGCSFVEFVCDIDGGMVAACSVVDCHLASDAEIERLRAELADLRKRLHEFVLDLSQSAENYRVQYMLTHAEMMDDAADRLVDLLEAKPADERVG